MYSICSIRHLRAEYVTSLSIGSNNIRLTWKSDRTFWTLSLLGIPASLAFGYVHLRKYSQPRANFV